MNSIQIFLDVWNYFNFATPLNHILDNLNTTNVIYKKCLSISMISHTHIVVFSSMYNRKIRALSLLADISPKYLISVMIV